MPVLASASVRWKRIGARHLSISKAVPVLYTAGPAHPSHRETENPRVEGHDHRHLALTTALSIAGCNGKPQEAASNDATAVATPATPAATPQTPVDHPPARPVGEVDLAGIARADGGKTVAEVFAESAALANQKVSVRGKVVKTNAGIMNKDWLHVRDGSGADGTNDLTVTTTVNPLPNIGDTVVISGTVVVDKDFGMGYQYPVLIEDAAVTIEAAAQ